MRSSPNTVVQGLTHSLLFSHLAYLPARSQSFASAKAGRGRVGCECPNDQDPARRNRLGRGVINGRMSGMGGKPMVRSQDQDAGDQTFSLTVGCRFLSNGPLNRKL